MKNKPTEKTVLLFSGGLDSLIAAKLLNPDILLYLNYGGMYQEQEIRNIKNLQREGEFREGKYGEVTFRTITNLITFEREDLIIPLRNLFLINYAALYGETIIMGAMYGDRSLDKSPEFFKKTSDLLSYLYSEQHWCEEREIKVIAPFKDKTKTEIVKQYLDEGNSVELLLKSYSCYSGNEEPCLKCKPCFRKSIALINNGIEVKNFKIKNFTWFTDELLLKIRSFEYRGEKEDREILNALNL